MRCVSSRSNASHTAGAACTAARNCSRGMTRRSVVIVAVTLAERALPSSAAVSPKNASAPRSASSISLPFGALMTRERSEMRAAVLTAAISVVALGYPGAGPARAHDAVAPLAFYEIETKYIFGFTEGSGVGLEGEKEFSVDTVGRFGKRDGRYAATETKFELEYTPNQYIELEFGPLAAGHFIRNVADLDDRNTFRPSGLFG